MHDLNGDAAAPVVASADPVRFDGRVAIVTGAGTGLGREYALMLAARGAKVVINDTGRSMDGVHGEAGAAAGAVVEAILAAGGQAIACEESVADPAGVQRMIDLALTRWNRLDILVNNAGILRTAPLADMALADVEAMIAVHLMGTLYCTRAALPAMRKQGYGRIVLTTSGVGMRGLPQFSIYAAAKSAMIGLMESVRLETEGQGVTINAIAPSAITRMSSHVIPPDIAVHMKSSLVAPMVAWLASERCTDSGAIINAGGGNFRRLAIYQGRGVQFDPVEPVSPEMIATNWAAIADMSDARPFAGTLPGLAPNLRKLGRL